MWFTGLAFIASLAFAIAGHGETDLSERYFFTKSPRNSCIGGKREQGLCVHLNECPGLMKTIRGFNTMHLLQALNGYTCGFDQAGVQVCCPGTMNGQTSRPNWRPQSPPDTSFTREPTQRPRPAPEWSAQSENIKEEPATRPPPARPPPTRPPTPRPQPTRPPPTRTTTESRRETPSLPSDVRTNHRNRRLLPEEQCGLELTDKIIGGNETALEEHPWMALLRLRFASGRKVFSCGGSLINSRYVLTAAHCIKNQRLSGAVIDQVRLGEHDQNEEQDCDKFRCSPPPLNIDVEDRIVHANYKMNDPTQENDIALLRLKTPVKFSSFVQPICLPLDDLQDRNYDSQDMWTAGWGKTNNGANSNSAVKLKVKLPIVPYDICAPKYRSSRMFLTESQICAGGEEGKDSCQGDSGGPLMSQDVVGSAIRWHVQGIVSIGPDKCGTAGSPGIYTRVGKYLDWILDNMKQ